LVASNDRYVGRLLLTSVQSGNGNARRTAYGLKIKLNYFEQDPTDDAPEPSDEQVGADIEALGLTAFLPGEE